MVKVVLSWISFCHNHYVKKITFAKISGGCYIYMKFLIQRVNHAQVNVDGNCI